MVHAPSPPSAAHRLSSTLDKSSASHWPSAVTSAEPRPAMSSCQPPDPKLVTSSSDSSGLISTLLLLLVRSAPPVKMRALKYTNLPMGNGPFSVQLGGDRDVESHPGGDRVVVVQRLDLAGLDHRRHHLTVQRPVRREQVLDHRLLGGHRVRAGHYRTPPWNIDRYCGSKFSCLEAGCPAVPAAPPAPPP